MRVFVLRLHLGVVFTASNVPLTIIPRCHFCHLFTSLHFSPVFFSRNIQLPSNPLLLFLLLLLNIYFPCLCWADGCQHSDKGETVFCCALVLECCRAFIHPLLAGKWDLLPTSNNSKWVMTRRRAKTHLTLYDNVIFFNLLLLDDILKPRVRTHPATLGS